MLDDGSLLSVLRQCNQGLQHDGFFRFWQCRLDDLMLNQQAVMFKACLPVLVRFSFLRFSNAQSILLLKDTVSRRVGLT